MLGLEPRYIWRPARNNSSGSDTAGKLRSDRGAAVAFEEHFLFSAFASRDQIRLQLAIHLSPPVNVNCSQILCCRQVDSQRTAANRTAAIFTEADPGQIL